MLSNLYTSRSLVGEQYTGHLESTVRLRSPGQWCPRHAVHGRRERRSEEVQATLGPVDLAAWGYLKQNSFAPLPSSFPAPEVFHLVVLAVLLFHWLTAYIAPYATASFPYNAAVDSLDV